MPPLPKSYLNSIPATVKTRQRDGTPNYFRPAELMAVKKWARNKFAELRDEDYTKQEAGLLTVQAVHRMLPGFVEAWEKEHSPVTWIDIGGDVWFEGRINHQSSGADNKKSHMRLEEFLDQDFDDRVFSWEEWKSAVKDRMVKTDLLRTWYVYVLPMLSPKSGDYDIQKVGISAVPYERLGHYQMCSKRNSNRRHTYGLTPAKRFAFLYDLGKMYEHEAKHVESQCHVAAGNGGPAAHGVEWFPGTTQEIISRLKRITDNHVKRV